MSDNTLTTSYEDEIRRWGAEAQSKLDAGRAEIIAAAEAGAVLGMHLDEWRKQKHIRNDEEFWNALTSCAPDLRGDTVRFGLRAMQMKRKGEELLGDYSQLTFALAMPGEEGRSSGSPVSRETNEVLVATNSILRVSAFFTEWQEKVPLSKWDASVKAGMREALRPLVELWRRLEE